MADKLEHAPVKNVLIELSGGCISHVEVPFGVRLILRDYDNRDEDEDDDCEYTEDVWEGNRK